jgi:putative copper export protein
MPSQVLLWFSEDVNGAASRIVVLDEKRRVASQDDTAVVFGQPRQLRVDLKPLHPGTYLVLWSAFSADDGHLTRGWYVFHYKYRTQDLSPHSLGISGTRESASGLDSAGQVGSHWIELLGAVTWLGFTFMAGLVVLPAVRALPATSVRRMHRHTWALLTITLLVVGLASLVAMGMQVRLLSGSVEGAPLDGIHALRSLFAGQYGQLWVARGAVILVMLLVLGVQHRTLHRAWPLLSSGAVLYLYLLAASSHAASSTVGSPGGQHLLSIAILVDWLHLVGVGVWLGGQFFLALVLIPSLRETEALSDTSMVFLNVLNRFSPFAYGGVAALTAGGALTALIQFRSWDQVWHTTYGHLLIAKTVLFALMVLVSGYTVFFLRRGIARRLAGETPATSPLVRVSVRRLMRWLAINPVVGIVILLAAATMFFNPLPVRSSPFRVSSYVVAARGLVAHVRVAPNRLGPNRLRLDLRDVRGTPVYRAHVVVLTNMEEMDMGVQRIVLRHVAGGQYEAAIELGMGGGTWHFQFLVYRPSGLTRLAVNDLVGA